MNLWQKDYTKLEILHIQVFGRISKTIFKQRTGFPLISRLKRGLTAFRIPLVYGDLHECISVSSTLCSNHNIYIQYMQVNHA